MKKITANLLLIGLLIFQLLIGVRCNNSSSGGAEPDSSKVTSDTTRMSVDTTEKSTGDTHVDTTSIAHEQARLRSAVLGYSYFKEMKRQETKFIHAFISVNNSTSKVKDTLSFLNVADGLEKGNDTTSIFTRNMAVYKHVRVTLVNGEDSGFKITQIHDSARQEIDSLGGNHWEWAVTPLTNEKTGLLILKVVAEKPDGSEEAFNAQSIPIKVDLDLNLFRRVWNYLSDNPSVLLTAILIPLVAFFGRRLFGKKKDK